MDVFEDVEEERDLCLVDIDFFLPFLKRGDKPFLGPTGRILEDFLVGVFEGLERFSFLPDFDFFGRGELPAEDLLARVEGVVPSFFISTCNREFSCRRCSISACNSMRFMTLAERVSSASRSA